jgi:cysteine desulfurase
MRPRPIYLDYAATTPVHPEVRAAVLSALDGTFGNPSSSHWAGQAAAQRVEQARAEVAARIGAPPATICFTSGATESDNLALLGLMRCRPPDAAHLITSAIEHHAILHAARQLEREGYAVTYVPVDGQGLVDPDAVRRAIQPTTALISIMLVNNEVGSVQPIQEIGEVARAHEVVFHTDAVQALGVMDISVDDLNVDLLSLSAHKIYGPKGVGALYIREGTPLSPTTFGGAQEQRRRAGTENVPGIVGLGTAARLTTECHQAERQHLHALRQQVLDGLGRRGLPVCVNGPGEAVAPHVVSLSFPHCDGEAMLFRLNAAGIAVSTGSACTSRSVEPSHVLTAMGLPREHIDGTLRLSLGYPTTPDEVDAFLDVIVEVVTACRLEGTP